MEKQTTFNTVFLNFGDKNQKRPTDHCQKSKEPTNAMGSHNVGVTGQMIGLCGYIMAMEDEAL